MGRRFERERDDMTAMPEQEEAIFAKLDCAPLPADKTVLDLACPALTIDGRTLCRDIRLTVRAKDKLCICGKNGVGKSTLLRLIRDTLEKRADLRVLFTCRRIPAACSIRVFRPSSCSPRRAKRTREAAPCCCWAA